MTGSNNASARPSDAGTPARPARALLFLRGILVFLAALALLAGIWYFALHHLDNIAEWSGGDEPTDAIVYDGKTFLYAAPIGAYAMTDARYPLGDLLGEVKPVSGLPRSHTFELYAVKEKDHFLRVVMEDGSVRIYYDESIDNPYHGEPETDTDEDDLDEWEEE